MHLKIATIKIIFISILFFAACESKLQPLCPKIPVDFTPDCLLGTKWVYHDNSPQFHFGTNTEITVTHITFEKMGDSLCWLMWQPPGIFGPTYIPSTYHYQKPCLVMLDGPILSFNSYANIINDTMYLTRFFPSGEIREIWLVRVEPD